MLRLHIYRITASLGLFEMSLNALGMGVDTEAGPKLVRSATLSAEWLRQVGTSKEDEHVRLRYADNATPRTSGAVTLWLRKNAWVVHAFFLAFLELSLPVMLGFTFIDDNAHAILPQDWSISTTAGSVTAVLRGTPG